MASWSAGLTHGAMVPLSALRRSSILSQKTRSVDTIEPLRAFATSRKIFYDRNGACFGERMSLKKQMKRRFGKKATQRGYAAIPWVGGGLALMIGSD